MSETEIIQPSIDINNNDEKNTKKSKKQDTNTDPPRIVHIKEFDINSIPPHEVADNSGVKIVVIGKPGCFAPGTEVLMYDGTVKKVEDVKVGDILMGDDNTPRNVQELYHDTEEMFEIKPNKGESYTVNLKHDLVLECTGYNQIAKGTRTIISVKDYLQKTATWQRRWKLTRSTGVEWPEKDVDIDPYFLGLWLGDGTSATLNITNIDNEVIDFCKSYAEELNLSFNKLEAKYRYSITSKTKTKDQNTLLNSFNSYNLINNKHIPQIYKSNSKQVRLELLAGLIDTDGYLDIKNKMFEITQKNKTLADDIVFIVRSLGFGCTIREVTKSCNYKDEIREGIYYRINIYGSGLSNIPTKILRKQLTEEPEKNKNHLVTGFQVISKGVGEYYGFSLDKNRLFLLKSCDIVKNTGKSTIIADILASKSHIVPVAQIFSGTEDSNHFFSEKFPGVCVYNKLDLDAIENFITRQKIAKSYLPNPWAFQIIDDCTDDPKILKRPIFQSYYKLGRHWKMIHILSLQYCLDIQPNIRANIDYTFILRESSKRFRKSLWENYASAIDNLDDFCDIMDGITEDYTALVINNRIQSNKLEDCVFWYKAKKDRLPPNWKFGHPSAWQFHLTRFDPNYVDPMN
jgi:intein/homing endonuclease